AGAASARRQPAATTGESASASRAGAESRAQRRSADTRLTVPRWASGSRRERVAIYLDICRLCRVGQDRRPSRQTAGVLEALAARPSEWRYGYELGLEVGLR